MKTKTKELLIKLKELHKQCNELFTQVESYQNTLPIAMQDELDMPFPCMDQAELNIRCAINAIEEIEGYDKEEWKQ